MEPSVAPASMVKPRQEINATSTWILARNAIAVPPTSDTAFSRSRPPVQSTCILPHSPSISAARSPLVTTVRPLRCPNSGASCNVVEEESINTVCPSCTKVNAARAMRSFAWRDWAWRSKNGASCPLPSISTAPPWVRCKSPLRSMRSRSRRMVAPLTSNFSASSSTVATRRSRSQCNISCILSTANIPLAPLIIYE